MMEHATAPDLKEGPDTLITLTGQIEGVLRELQQKLDMIQAKITGHEPDCAENPACVNGIRGAVESILTIAGNMNGQASSICDML